MVIRMTKAHGLRHDAHAALLAEPLEHTYKALVKIARASGRCVAGEGGKCEPSLQSECVHCAASRAIARLERDE